MLSGGTSLLEQRDADDSVGDDFETFGSSRSTSSSSGNSVTHSNAEHEYSYCSEQSVQHDLMLDFSPSGVYVVVDVEESSPSPVRYHHHRARAGHEQADFRANEQNRVRPRDQTMLVTMMAMVGFFALCEWVGGAWSGSLSLLGDSFHMLSDFIALLVGFLAMRLALRDESQSKSYGWQRAGVIGALMNGVFLMSACVFILTDATARLALERQRIDEPLVVLIVGALGLAVNIIGLLMFCGHRQGHGHSHSHGHSHAHSHAGSMNMHGVFLHILSDALGSLIVIGVALLHLFTDATDVWVAFFDPICSILLSAFLIKTSYPLIRDSVYILMQSVPYSVDINQIEQQILKVDGVDALHALHVWQLDERRIIASVHVACKTHCDRFGAICRDIKQIMHKHNIHDSAVQPEFSGTHHERRAAALAYNDNYHETIDQLNCNLSDSLTEKSVGGIDQVDWSIVESPRTCVDSDWCCDKRATL